MLKTKSVVSGLQRFRAMAIRPRCRKSGTGDIDLVLLILEIENVAPVRAYCRTSTDGSSSKKSKTSDPTPSHNELRVEVELPKCVQSGNKTAGPNREQPQADNGDSKRGDARGVVGVPEFAGLRTGRMGPKCK